MPWIGATYMRISESRTTMPPPGSTESPATDSADAGLWGVVLGVDASYRVWSTLDVTGRVLFRWATGTRTASINSQDPGGWDGQGQRFHRRRDVGGRSRAPVERVQGVLAGDRVAVPG